MARKSRSRSVRASKKIDVQETLIAIFVVIFVFALIGIISFDVQIGELNHQLGVTTVDSAGLDLEAETAEATVAAGDSAATVASEQGAITEEVEVVLGSGSGQIVVEEPPVIAATGIALTSSSSSFEVMA